MKDIKKFCNNDRVQNSLALYYLFEYGKQTLQDEVEVSKIKEQIKLKNNGKNPILQTEYILGAIDIAMEMAESSVQDLSNYIYNNVKERRKQERKEGR